MSCQNQWRKNLRRENQLREIEEENASVRAYECKGRWRRRRRLQAYSARRRDLCRQLKGLTCAISAYRAHQWRKNVAFFSFFHGSNLSERSDRALEQRIVNWKTECKIKGGEGIFNGRGDIELKRQAVEVAEKSSRFAGNDIYRERREVNPRLELGLEGLVLIGLKAHYSNIWAVGLFSMPVPGSKRPFSFDQINSGECNCVFRGQQ